MAIRVKCGGIDVALISEPRAFNCDLTCDEVSDGLFDVRLRATAATPAALPTLTLSWELPSVDFHYKWNSRCYQNRALDQAVGTENYTRSRANTGMPVYCLYNLEGVNACTWAISDAIHDTITGGAYHDGKVYECKAEIHGERIGTVSEYAVTVRFDFRRVPYYVALRDVSQWWEGMDAYRPCLIPDAARMPLLSTWYSYKLRLDPEDLENQCVIAKEMGMDTVVLDDGWQTDQQEFGYQNNGDWEVSTAKFPDFAGHVKRVQDLGMKYMVWFAVPFVGVESKAYERFQDMLMPKRDDATYFSLDPRFAETRNYVVETLERFLLQYGVDGFKLDFIGSVESGWGLPDKPDDRRDSESVGEGVCKLLDLATARLTAAKPDILIEFRQDYVGPAMRRYGTMFRAVDCPNSIGDNRVRTLDLRLLCGKTAVHSDPITWHDDEPVESAAMQIIHALFAVPQISQKVTELKKQHHRMLRQQLAFAREHRDVLQEGELRPFYPHQLYPLVVAKTRSKLLAAFYSGLPLRLEEPIPDQLILVNGSYNPDLLVDLAEPPGLMRITVTSCTGNTLTESEVHLSAGLNRIGVPAAAHAVIRRKPGL